MNEEIKEKEGLWAYLKRRTFTITLADVALVVVFLAAVDLALAIIDGIFNDW